MYELREYAGLNISIIGTRKFKKPPDQVGCCGSWRGPGGVKTGILTLFRIRGNTVEIAIGLIIFSVLLVVIVVFLTNSRTKDGDWEQEQKAFRELADKLEKEYEEWLG